MNKLRVFKNVFYKGTASGFSVKNPGTVLLLLLLIPYIITSVFGNASEAAPETEEVKMIKEQLREGGCYVWNRTKLGTEKIPLEIYTADMLERTMGEDYEMEAMKAQAILIRTNLIREGDGEITVCDEQYGKKETGGKYLRAVLETRGICLEYEGVPVYGAYFLVSGGSTRRAGDIRGMEDYPYLTPVSCDRDYLSEDYIHRVEYSREEFERAWESVVKIEEEEAEELPERAEREVTGEMTIIRDSAGYALFLQYGQKWAPCEELRYELRLPSSNFDIKEESGKIVFTVKGSGHGLGLSQFGANEMALEGRNCEEILKYFFQGISFTKVPSS